jgi:hypothetical protein
MVVNPLHRHRNETTVGYRLGCIFSLSSLLPHNVNKFGLYRVSHIHSFCGLWFSFAGTELWVSSLVPLFRPPFVRNFDRCYVNRRGYIA